MAPIDSGLLNLGMLHTSGEGRRGHADYAPHRSHAVGRRTTKAARKAPSDTRVARVNEVMAVHGVAGRCDS